jgi:alkanesulfonate monooxygenase SsuD/methylene tetrahydromethanopterin reductase-like flavin-dependent oxidoreductase (luciferase family)
MTATLEFGISITPTWADQDQVVQLALLADQAGLDLIGIQDHPYQWRFYDTWSLMSYLAGRTSRVRFFPDVTSLPLRPPAILAKAAASLDVLTGGRVELGLGAGGFWDAIAAMGGPRRTPGEAVEATEEAIDVIRLVWSGERGVRYDGRHYRLAGLHTGPRPAHDIGIWVGAGGPRMLDLIGRKADGWVPSAPWAPPEALPDYLRRIEEAAAAAGRDPRSIRRAYNLMGAIGPTTGKRFEGPVRYWVDELAAVAETGMDAFIFWPGGEDPAGQVEVFAAEVVPGVRAAVRGS